MKHLDGIGKPILVASHPRSGTHLTIDLLRKQFVECSSYKYWGESLDHLYLPLEGLIAGSRPLPYANAVQRLKRAQRPILKSHANPKLTQLHTTYPDFTNWIQQEADVFYIVRDGRDVLCSLHLFMQSYDPTTRCSFSEFLRQAVNGKSRVKTWATHIRQWQQHPKVCIVRFEDLIHSPESTLNRRFVGAAETESTVTLDQIYGVHSALHDQVSLIKVDVEGAEVEVLQGAKELLRSPHHWVVEVHGEHLLPAVLDCFAQANRMVDLRPLQPHWLLGAESRVIPTIWVTTCL
jgi:FkbM family methyltransferase